MSEQNEKRYVKELLKERIALLQGFEKDWVKAIDSSLERITEAETKLASIRAEIKELSTSLLVDDLLKENTISAGSLITAGNPDGGTASIKNAAICGAQIKPLTKDSSPSRLTGTMRSGTIKASDISGEKVSSTVFDEMHTLDNRSSRREE